MGVPRLSNIIIGMILVTTIITGMIMFLSGGSSVYTGSTYDNTTLSPVVESFNTINDNVKSARDRTSNITITESVTDPLGILISGAVDSAKIAGSSISVLSTWTDTSLLKIPFISTFGTFVKSALFLMAIVIIIIAIVLNILTKSERT